MTATHRFGVIIAAMFSSLIAGRALAQSSRPWVDLKVDVQVEEKQKDGSMVQKPGAISAIAVDRANGDVYAFVRGSGVWKSTDVGKTFTLSYEMKQGSCESSYALYVDQDRPGRVLCLLLGGKSAITLDAGKTWKPINQEGRFLAVDWSDPQAQTIACRVGGHSTWMLTRDGGATWNPLKGQEWTWTVGMFDAKTWVVSGMKRSEDGGATWTDGEKLGSVAVMQTLDGVGYLLCNSVGLAVSRDKGKTWQMTATPKGTGFGPYFGKSAAHIVVATKDTIYESRNGGEKWEKVVALPVASGGMAVQGDHGGVDTLAYDPVHNVFYFCARGKAVGKWGRNE